MSDSRVSITSSGFSHILYDAALIENPELALFEMRGNDDTPGAPPAGQADGQAVGRAPVYFFRHAGRRMVLRHYYRGGLMAKALGDWYFGYRPERSRAFREWCLLHTLYRQGLPAPRPVAAHMRRYGLLYQADLVTVEIEQAETLADRLARQPLAEAGWRAVGHCIARFHRHRVCHADLNARNILLQPGAGGADTVWLIDFDRGRIRRRDGHWRRANLQRLRRSLLKFAAQDRGFAFSESGWRALLAAYEAALIEP